MNNQPEKPSERIVQITKETVNISTPMLWTYINAIIQYLDESHASPAQPMFYTYPKDSPQKSKPTFNCSKHNWHSNMHDCIECAEEKFGMADTETPKDEVEELQELIMDCLKYGTKSCAQILIDKGYRKARGKE